VIASIQVALEADWLEHPQAAPALNLAALLVDVLVFSEHEVALLQFELLFPETLILIADCREGIIAASLDLNRNLTILRAAIVGNRREG